jgi:hypothetical protein
MTTAEALPSEAMAMAAVAKVADIGFFIGVVSVLSVVCVAVGDLGKLLRAGGYDCHSIGQATNPTRHWYFTDTRPNPSRHHPKYLRPWNPLVFSAAPGSTLRYPWGLTGDRHIGIRTQDGRFVFAFRDLREMPPPKSILYWVSFAVILI